LEETKTLSSSCKSLAEKQMYSAQEAIRME